MTNLADLSKERSIKIILVDLASVDNLTAKFHHNDENAASLITVSWGISFDLKRILG